MYYVKCTMRSARMDCSIYFSVIYFNEIYFNENQVVMILSLVNNVYLFGIDVYNFGSESTFAEGYARLS